MTAETATNFARELCRSANPRFRSIGQKLLAIKKDADLVVAVQLIQTVISSLPKP